MTDRRRLGLLVAIAGAVAAIAFGLLMLGSRLDSPLLRFMGLMTGATTFVPLPADSFVLSASANLDPITVGVVGGVINAAMVLVERHWVRLFVGHPSFDRFVGFFDSNRLVALTRRNMFLALVVGGATFIPFEPFRLVAVLSDYPAWRYALATFVSRGGRYYILALLGTALLEVGLLQQAIWITLGLFAVGLWRTAVRLMRQNAPEEA